MSKLIDAVKSLKVGKAQVIDDIHSEMFKVGELKPLIYSKLLDIIRRVWREEKVPQLCKDATLTMLFKKEDQTQCGNYRSIALTSHFGKIFMKMIACRLSEYVKENAILPEQQCSFRPKRSTIDILFVARNLPGFARQGIMLYWCFVALAKAYGTVNRQMLWTRLGKYGVPNKLNHIIRDFHDCMPARIKGGNDEADKWFEVTLGLRQGCMLSLLMFNLFFTAVLKVAAKNFKKQSDVLNDIVQVRYRYDGIRDPILDAVKRRAKTKSSLQKIWSLLYADDAGIVSRSLPILSKMMASIVSVCRDFGLRLSENTNGSDALTS